MQGKPAVRAMLLLFLALAASADVFAGPPLQHQAVMMVSATVVASCKYSSHSSALADRQTNTASSDPTLTVSCTPGSGKLYTASIKNDGKNPSQAQNGLTTASLIAADSDASTRVFTISSKADGGFVKLSLNY